MQVGGLDDFYMNYEIFGLILMDHQIVFKLLDGSQHPFPNFCFSGFSFEKVKNGLKLHFVFAANCFLEECCVARN